MADENGHIEHVNKNHKDNLIALCKECHSNQHKKNLKLEYKKTSQGSELFINELLN